MKTYQIIKTLGPENGFTCAYRQWRAKSDCKYIHGYSLGFILVTFLITFCIINVVLLGFVRKASPETL